MQIQRIIVQIIAVSAIAALPWGCAKQDDTVPEESGADVPQSTVAPADDGQAGMPDQTALETTAPGEGEVHSSDVKKQADEVRAAFLALQQICRAGDIDGYVAFWDDETKKQIDGRDLDVAQRRQRRRASLQNRPETLPEIANAKIESIAVDTTQAEKTEKLLGVTVEGTMMVVFTDGPALLFHETDAGWKLFTKAPSDYFRQP